MRKNKWFLFSLCLFLIPIGISLVYYSQLPSVVPTHFDMNGQVDGTMPKALGTFGVIVFCVLIHLFVSFVTSKDPKHKNIPDFMFHIIYMICPIICIVVNLMVIFHAIPSSLDVIKISNVSIYVLVSLMMIVLGNYLPKVKRNYTLGIKTPWALNSDENWHRTNRFGGYCMVLSGFLFFVFSMLGQLLVAIILLIGLSIVPMIYSYILYKQGV